MSFNLITPVYLLAVGLCIFFIAKGPSTKRACGLWAFTCQCFLVLNLAVASSTDLANPPYPLNVNLLLGTAALCAIGTLISLWRNFQQGAGDGGTGVLNSVAVTFGLGVAYMANTPASVYPRETANRTQCKNNLKRLAIGMHNYHDAHEQFHPAWQSPHQNSWRVGILPYLGKDAYVTYFERYDQNAAWDSPDNLPLSRTFVSEYDCPGGPDHQRWNAEKQFMTPYIVPFGNDALFHGNQGPRIRDVTDGTSNTLMILEACGNPVVWTQPRDLSVEGREPGINLPSATLHRSGGLMSSYHQGGAQAALADGSVRFISADVDPDLLKALVTPHGGEEVGEF